MNQFHSVKVSQLEVPGLTANMAVDVNPEAAKKMLAVNPLVYRNGDHYRLLNYKREMASLIALGMTDETIRCRMYEGDGHGADLLEQYDPEREPESQHQLVADLVDITRRSLPEPVPNPKGGRPSTNQMEAIRRVSETLGITARAVQAMLRKTKPAANINAFGLRVDPAMLEALESSRRWYAHASHRLTGIYNHAESAERLASPMLPKLLSGARALADAIRQETPVAICPYCKLLDGLCQTCEVCGGNGWASRSTIESCHPRLLDTGDKLAVARNGSIVPYVVAMDGDLW
jgi:hypothetical protein